MKGGHDSRKARQIASWLCERDGDLDDVNFNMNFNMYFDRAKEILDAIHGLGMIVVVAPAPKGMKCTCGHTQRSHRERQHVSGPITPCSAGGCLCAAFVAAEGDR